MNYYFVFRLKSLLLLLIIIIIIIIITIIIIIYAHLDLEKLLPESRKGARKVLEELTIYFILIGQ